MWRPDMSIGVAGAGIRAVEQGGATDPLGGKNRRPHSSIVSVCEIVLEDRCGGVTLNCFGWMRSGVSNGRPKLGLTVYKNWLSPRLAGAAAF